MIYTDLTRKAIRIAFQAHRDQKDKAGLPYILHPLHVAEGMKDEISCCAALLHDVVEDSFITLDRLRLEFPSEVIKLVSLLTHEKTVPYFDYIRLIKTDPMATQIKKADLLHNMDQSRLIEITPEDRKRLEKYRTAYAMLLEGAEKSCVRIITEESDCPYHSLKKGQEFIVKNETPAFCSRLWNLIYPDVCVLLAKETVDKKPSFQAHCPMGKVKVRMERLDG